MRVRWRVSGRGNCMNSLERESQLLDIGREEELRRAQHRPREEFRGDEIEDGVN